MYERVYLRKVDEETHNKRWVISAKGVPGTVTFVQEDEMEGAVTEARLDGYADGCRETEERQE